MPTLLILGATSDIARATAEVFGLNGWSLELIARDEELTKKIANDLSIKLNNNVIYHIFDILSSDPSSIWQSLKTKPDAVLCAIGAMGNQEQAQTDWSLTDKILKSNFFALVPILDLISSEFEKRGSGIIIGISSVAGDRGRASNYIYGSAKAAFTTYLSGLRNRFSSKGIQVITVKPGYVNTKMTENYKLPKILTAQPIQVGTDIWKAFAKKRDIIYSLWFWRWIMVIIKLIPEFLFKKLKL